MAKRQQKAEDEEPQEKGVDRHRPSMMVRIPMPFAVQLEKLAALHLGSPSEEVRHAVREYLERQGLWPPPPEAVE